MNKQHDLITAALRERGGSYYGLGQFLGIRSRGHVQRMRRGEHVIHDPKHVERAAEYTGIPADDLYLAAGDLPPDVVRIILRHGKVMLNLIRLAAQRMED